MLALKQERRNDVRGIMKLLKTIDFGGRKQQRYCLQIISLIDIYFETYARFEDLEKTISRHEHYKGIKWCTKTIRYVQNKTFHSAENKIVIRTLNEKTFVLCVMGTEKYRKLICLHPNKRGNQSHSSASPTHPSLRIHIRIPDDPKKLILILTEVSKTRENKKIITVLTFI